MEEYWKGDCDLRSVVDEVHDTSRLPGSEVGEILVYGGSVLLVANGIIRTAKQLPEVSRTAVGGRAALCCG